MGGLGCCMGVQLEATGQAGGGGGPGNTSRADNKRSIPQTIKGQYRLESWLSHWSNDPHHAPGLGPARVGGWEGGAPHSEGGAGSAPQWTCRHRQVSPGKLQGSQTLGPHVFGSPEPTCHRHK